MLERLKSEYQKNPDSIQTNRAIAEYYLNNNMEEEAEPYLIRMLDIDGEKAFIHNQLAVVYFKRSQYHKAEHHLKEALKLDSRMAEAHFNLAFLYQTQGRFAEALPCYKQAANFEPDDPEIYRLMAQCAQAEGMIQEAEVFLAESFRLEPTAETALELTIVYITEEKYPEAEDLLKFLMDLAESETAEDTSQDIPLSIGSPRQTENSDPPAGLSHIQQTYLKLDRESLSFALGLVLAKQGKYMNAIKHLRNLVMTDQNNEQALNYLGECCVAIGLDREAESFLTKASKINPRYLRPIINLGKLYYEQGRYNKAIAAMQQYLKVIDGLVVAQDQDVRKFHSPETEIVYELLRMSYLQIGDRAKAMEVWKEYLEIKPDQPQSVSLTEDSPFLARY